jgi:hypothetical protein
MRSLRWFASSFLVFSTVVAGSARASATAGAIKGQVIDDGGLSIAGALITLSCQSLIGGRQQRTADDAGVFSFVELPPGTCTLVAEKQGFGAVTKTGVEVALGRTTPVTIELRPGGEELTVVAPTPAIDSDPAVKSTTFTKEATTPTWTECRRCARCSRSRSAARS